MQYTLSMNEIIFIFHVVAVIAFGLGALKLGKEALIAWMAFQAVLANLFVIKQISFLSFEVTCSDVFIIGSTLGLNLLQEYFGKDSAKKAVWVCFFILTFFALMSQIHLFYLPSIHDTTQSAFSTILQPAPRLLLASIGVFFFVQQIDLRVYAKLAKFPLPLKNGISLVFSQLIDTILFSYFGLYGNVSEIFDVIIVSFLIKIIVIFCMTPFLVLTKRIYARS